MTHDVAGPSVASAGSQGGGFNQWLASIGKTRETATDADEIQWLRMERQSLRGAIRKLADQDATLSVCDGNVTVTMDATLTDEEREAIAYAELALRCETHPVCERHTATLRSLLRRLGVDF